MQLRILHQDDQLIAVDKPAGFHVHPPEDQTHRISKNTNCLYLLRKQLGFAVHPVHRLDRATSGVVLFAKTSEVASHFGAQFREQGISKTYYAVTRGWTPLEGVIDHPLRSEHDDEVRKDSRTEFRRVATVEFAESVGRYSSARYSLVRVVPHTGRMHQIRRHFDHISHPLAGDTVYGDGAHNRLWRAKLGKQALLLHAHAIEFEHPATGARMRVQARWTGTWHQVFDLFGVCAWERGGVAQGG